MASASVHRDRTAGAVARGGSRSVDCPCSREVLVSAANESTRELALSEDAASAGEPLWRAIAEAASTGEV